MKKLLTMAAVAATVGFCALDAKAGIGITTNYDTLNITYVVTTNTSKATATGYTDKFVSIRHANKDVLTLLEGADFANFTFPPDSKLVAAWDASNNVPNGTFGDVCVVDKTGTNVLYDATTNYWYNPGGSYIYLDFFFADGPDSEDYVDPTNGLGHDIRTRYNSTYFEIFDNESGLDLFTYGRDTEHFTQNWKSTSTNFTYTTWTDSENALTSWDASDELVSGYVGADIKATITSDGHGKGVSDLY